MFSFYKKLDGYFSDEPVEFIQTSDITAYIKDSDGAFHCTNVECPNDWIRYRPLLKRKIPDCIKCPKCQHWMINRGLENLWGQSVDDLKKSGSGTPQIYQKALTGCAVFNRLCRAYLLVDPQDNIRQVAAISAFDIILDIGAIIFDNASIKKVADAIDQFEFTNYTENSASFALENLRQYHSFYEAMLQGKTYAQVDLKKKMLSSNESKKAQITIPSPKNKVNAARLIGETQGTIEATITGKDNNGNKLIFKNESFTEKLPVNVKIDDTFIEITEAILKIAQKHPSIKIVSDGNSMLYSNKIGIIEQKKG